MNLILWLLVWLTSALAMPESSFATLNHQVEQASFSSDKLSVLRAAASTNTFTSAQVASLIQGISFSNDQLDALRLLAPRLEDPQNQYQILGAFTFSSDKQKAEQILASVSRAAPTPAPAPAPAVGGMPSCTGDSALPPLEVSFTSAWSDADVNALVTALKKASFSDDKLSVLRTAMAGRVDGLSSRGVLAVLDAFGFSSDMREAIALMDDHLLGMTSAEVVGVIKAFNFSEDKLAVLDVLKDTITDAEHKFVILDAFTFSTDKQKASRMLEAVRPRSYLFGTVNSQRAVFVVDVSGSMEARFKTNQGRSWSRLDFVRCELHKVLTEQLTPNARFNIVLFSDGVTAWRQDLAAATPENIAAALDFLGRARAQGGTNLFGGLESGFTGNPDAVYLLTDGVPTAGRVQNPTQIASAAAQWSAGRVPVYSVAFLMGSHAGDNKPASAALMRDIAASTHGIYRVLE